MTRVFFDLKHCAMVAVAAWGIFAASESLGNNDVWKTAGGGNWSNGLAWVDGSTPAISDSATFNLPGSYTVSFIFDPQEIQELNLSNNANVTFASGRLPPNPIVPRTLPVTSATGSRRVSINSGATLTLGAESGSTSHPFHLTATNILVDVAATLNVRFGSDVNAGRVSILNQANIIGSGSTMTAATSLSVGGVTGVDSTPQDGVLSITGGGLVECLNATLGAQLNAAGTVTVTDSGSLWRTINRLQLGDLELGYGPGTVSIQPGGTVSVGQETVVSFEGRLRLQGGTLDTGEFRIEGNGQFEWTSGTFHVGTYHGDLLYQTGTLAPGNSAGSTTVLGNYTQQSAGVLEIEVGGVAQGAQYDIVNVTGDAALGGQLDLKLINGFVPNPDQTFVIFNTSGSISGAFGNVANGQRLLTSDGSGSFRVHYGQGSSSDPALVVLTDFRSGGLPGDFNGDGLVNAIDIDLLAIEAKKTQPSNLFYDLNGDGRVTYSVGASGVISSDSDMLIRSILQTQYGDLDLNGEVFLADLIKFATNYRQAGQFGWAQGNVNGSQEVGTAANPRVSLADLIALATHWRYGVGASSSSGGAVPEPSGVLLALCAAFAPPFRRANKFRSRSASFEIA